MKTIETERLVLRAFTMDDLEEIHRTVYADPNVVPFWGERVRTLEETRS